MAALVFEETQASRLTGATCVAGGTISTLLRRASHNATKTPPQGDLLLAAALSAAAVSATHFQTTKRAAGQRRELIRQGSVPERSYSQQAAALLTLAERAGSASSLSEGAAGGAWAPVVHNLRDSRRCSAQQQAPVLPCASSDSGNNWYFNLALQSSLL